MHPNSKKAQVNLSLLNFGQLEREKGFEPSTPTLARLCSTPELLPHMPVKSCEAGPIWPKRRLIATGKFRLLRDMVEIGHEPLPDAAFRLRKSP